MPVEILFDIDGVLGDLRLGMARAWPDAPTFTGYKGPNDPLDPVFEAWFHHEDRWSAGPVTTRDFWAMLPLYDDARQLLQLADDVEPLICSSPGRPEFVAAAAAGKHHWCAAQLDLQPRQVLLVDSRRKHMLAAPHRVLIDDTPHIVDRWNRAGGIGILYPQPWNRSPTDHLFTGDRIDWVRDEIVRRVNPPPEDTSGWNTCADCGKPIRPSCEFWWGTGCFCSNHCRLQSDARAAQKRSP